MSFCEATIAAAYSSLACIQDDAASTCSRTDTEGLPYKSEGEPTEGGDSDCECDCDCDPESLPDTEEEEEEPFWDAYDSEEARAFAPSSARGGDTKTRRRGFDARRFSTLHSLELESVSDTDSASDTDGERAFDGARHF